MDLKKISNSIVKELNEFNDVFRELLNTDVPLLNLILRYVTKKKGKQIRPTLVLLSAGLCGKINQRTYIGASMVELLHTATLIHDDVVDTAKVRRGIASINAAWNNKIAVLVGDYLLSQGLLSSVENSEFNFLKATSRSVKEMSEGELLAIYKGKDIDITEETYYRIIKGKTASLFSTCCEIGALSASKSEEDHENFKLLGEYLGLAFQIKDDLFDYTSKPSIIGKPVGNDIKENKITLPLIFALQNSNKLDKKNIINIFKKKELNKDDINKVIEFVNNNGGQDYAFSKAKEFIDKAKEIINKYQDSIYKDSIIKLSEFIIERKN